jgi:alpha-N-arabinofuranosidase
MEIEPVLAVFAGYALGGNQKDVPEESMRPILQEALDQLEYCMGPTSTRWGSMRAQHGHPEPFPINFVEIGNEDWFSKTVSVFGGGNTL